MCIRDRTQSDIGVRSGRPAAWFITDHRSTSHSYRQDVSQPGQTRQHARQFTAATTSVPAPGYANYTHSRRRDELLNNQLIYTQRRINSEWFTVCVGIGTVCRIIRILTVLIIHEYLRILFFTESVINATGTLCHLMWISHRRGFSLRFGRRI